MDALTWNHPNSACFSKNPRHNHIDVHIEKTFAQQYSPFSCNDHNRIELMVATVKNSRLDVPPNEEQFRHHV